MLRFCVCMKSKSICTKVKLDAFVVYLSAKTADI